LHVADEFQEKWQFPNCIGALDGKHIHIRKPGNSGAMYFNYKHTFSIVLMALVDADYRFLFVNVGMQGRIADGGIFESTALHKILRTGGLNIPGSKCFPNGDRPMPFAVVADDASPLRSYILKPFPFRQLTKEQRIFNYRLSRARRVIENAFGILANRFRVLLTLMHISPDQAEIMVMACCALHNMLRVKAPAAITANVDIEDPVTHIVTPGNWRDDPTMIPIPRLRGNNATKNAKVQRQYICDYFNSEQGSIPWQNAMI
jgi:hypothetical protein